MVGQILSKEELAPQIMKFVVSAPDIAQRRQPGQFVIIRAHELGERIPISVADTDPEKGTLTLVIQELGKSSAIINAMNVGERFHDVVGPLGRPTHIDKFGTCVGVGGGVGIPPLYPIAKALKEAGNQVISIIGGRSRPFVIMEEEIGSVSDEVIITTDDGSYGEKGFVTIPLERMLKEGKKIDYCIAIGPAIMMKNVCAITKPYGVTTFVSLNTIMVDGTGMCGACRVSYGDQTKFVCVDGPELDGHKIDFDEMLKRLDMYREQERKVYEQYLSEKAAAKEK